MAKPVAEMTIVEVEEERRQLDAQQTAIAARDADPNHTWTQADTDEDNRINERFAELTLRKQTLDAQRRHAEDSVRQREQRQANRDRLRTERQSVFGEPGRDDFDGNPNRDQRSDEQAEEDFALGLQGVMRSVLLGTMTEEQQAAARRMGLRSGCTFLGVPLFDQRHWMRAKPLWQSGGQQDFDQRMPNVTQRCLGWNGRTLKRDNLPEWRDMSAVTGNVGGYMIPTGFVQDIERQLLAFGGPRLVADIIRTDTGNDLPQPTMNDTNNKGVRLAESTTIGSSVDPELGQVTLKAWKYSSKAIRIPTELLEDSPFLLLSIITELLGERIGRIQSDEFTTGDGDSKPQGIVTASGIGVTTASATDFTYDEIVDLIHSVDPAYRNGGTGVGFMCHDNVLSVIRKKKDGNGRPMFELGEEGRADQLKVNTGAGLFKFPLTINQSMDSAMTATKVPLCFGNFKKYRIRDVNTMRVVVMKERYADVDQIGVVCFLRSDGKCVQTAAMKKLKLHA